MHVSVVISMSADSKFEEGMVQTIYLSSPLPLPSQPRPPRKCLTTEVEHLEETQNTSAPRCSRRRSSEVGKDRILVLLSALSPPLCTVYISKVDASHLTPLLIHCLKTICTPHLHFYVEDYKIGCLNIILFN